MPPTPDPSGQPPQQSFGEVLGATPKPFHLTEQPTTITIDLHEPSGPLRHRPGPLRYILTVEDYKATQGVPGYRYYLNLPPTPTREQMSSHLIDLLPIFGLQEASNPNGSHHGVGLTISTDITDLVARLTAERLWDGKRLFVTFIADHSTLPCRIDVSRVSISAR